MSNKNEIFLPLNEEIDIFQKTISNINTNLFSKSETSVIESFKSIQKYSSFSSAGTYERIAEKENIIKNVNSLVKKLNKLKKIKKNKQLNIDSSIILEIENFSKDNNEIVEDTSLSKLNLQYNPKKFKKRSTINLQNLINLATDPNKNFTLIQLATIFNVSKNTIHRTLKDLNIHYKIVKRSFLFSENVQVKKKQSDFYTWFKKNNINWMRSTFFDESIFLIDNIRPQKWQHESKKATLEIQNKGQFISLYLSLTLNGNITFSTFKNSNKKADFIAYLNENRTKLIENSFFLLQNYKHRVYFFLDNYKPHFSFEILDIIREIGFLEYYLPPYRPKANPVEYVFGLIKSRIKNIMINNL